MSLIRSVWRRLARIPYGAKHQCVICGRRVQSFLPYLGGSRSVPVLQRELKTVGSDPDHFECPACGCHDRERHAWMYLSALDLVQYWRGRTILHFAPERSLRTLITAQRPERYVCGDLYPHESGVSQMNIEAIPYADETFDFIIANHVLEHVDSPIKALHEITRCLKNGGYALLQTPYSIRLTHTLEDAGIESPMARLHAYGQEDHCRLFGNDVFEVLTSTGLISLQRTHDELLSHLDPVRLGVNVNEPLMLFQKK